MAKQALEGSRLNAFAMNPRDITITGFDTDADPSDPTFDERALTLLRRDDKDMMALIASVEAVGVLQPVLVTKDGDVVKALVGRRRVFAARCVNEQRLRDKREPLKIPVFAPVKGNEAELFARVIAENMNRVDDPPLVVGAKVARLVGFFDGKDESKGIEQAASVLGMTGASVRNYLALNRLAAPVRKLVDDGKLAYTAAVQLAALSREEQVDAANKLVSEGKGTVEGAKRERQKRTKGADAATSIPMTRLRAIVRLAQEDGDRCHLPADALKVLRAVVGDINPTSVKGLMELINRVDAGERATPKGE